MTFVKSLNPMVALFASGNWTPVTGQELDDGVLHQKFRKELMKVGQYKPQNREAFSITLPDLQHWVAVTKQMLANGVRIPVTAGPVPHEDVGNPQNSIGTLEDAFVEGESLFVVLDIVGEENIQNAVANDVSIFSPLEFVDGKGRKYERPITHVAIVSIPLVPDLEGWESIAASLETSNEGKEKGMWKKIAKALGVKSEGLTEENAESKILAAIKKMGEDHKEALKAAKKGATKASIDADADVKEVFDAEVKTEVDKQVVTKTAEIKASLTGAEIPDPDPVVVGLVETNRKLVLDTAITACLLTKVARDKIDAKYGENSAIAASLKAGDSGKDFDFWMDILKINNPVDLVEKSGAQVIKAALKDPNDGDKTKDEDNPLLKGAKAMRKAAGQE